MEIIKNISKTRSGLFVRHDPGFGLLVYSPYSGLIFACKEEHTVSVLSWLNKQTKTIPSIEYKSALGPGWMVSLKDANYPIPHLIPNDRDSWPILPKPQKPILINWLLTGQCPLKCGYCYAEDLMRGKCKEPTAIDIKSITKSILSYNPLVVVLTGGDPLVSPHLCKIIKILHKHVGIIVDTSAYIFDKKYLELFKKYNVFVRISLDSEIPKINDNLRLASPKMQKNNLSKFGTAANALDAICKCINAGIKVGVQTVATTKNYNDLEYLGDKLYRLGVSSWRVLMVVPSKARFQECKQLSGTNENRKRLYDYILKRIHYKYTREWNKKMAVQVTDNTSLNSVVLVGPDGIFYTESNVELGGKVILDSSNPRHPRLSQITKKVNINAHAERYLNLKWPNSWFK